MERIHATTPVTPAVTKEDSIQRVPMVQKSAVMSGEAPDGFEQDLKQSRRDGNSLNPQLRTQMEGAMGADFS